MSLYCSLSGHISSSYTVTALSLPLHQNIFHALLHIVNSTLSTNPGPFLFSVNRYNLPVGKQGGSCMIEISADNGTAQRLEDYVSHPMSEVTSPAVQSALHNSYNSSQITTYCIWYLLPFKKHGLDILTCWYNSNIIRHAQLQHQRVHNQRKSIIYSHVLGFHKEDILYTMLCLWIWIF